MAKRTVERTGKLIHLTPIEDKLLTHLIRQPDQHNVEDGFNNFVQIGFDASWGSELGYGNRIDIDLCHGCLKAALGPWLRISSSGDTVLGISASRDNAASE